MTKVAKKIKKISKELLKEETKETAIKEVKYNLTNDYNYDTIPIDMLGEEDKALLKAYFKETLKEYYYVEKTL